MKQQPQERISSALDFRESYGTGALRGAPAGSRAGALVRRLDIALVLLILLALALKLRLVWSLNVNWDEFLYLSYVYDYARGSVTNPFQSFHVHLFRWLPLVSGDEIDQVIVGRSVAFAAGLGSAVLTYAIGRMFLTRAGGLFAVLCWLSLSNLVEHGTSFRVDPLAAFLFLVTVYLVLRSPRVGIPVCLAGFSLAVALVLTVKAALYVPVMGAIFLGLARHGKDRSVLLRALLLLAAVTTGSFAALFLLHRAVLPTAAVGEAEFLGNVAAEMIVRDRLFPRFDYFVLTVIENPVVWGVFLVGGLVALRDSMRPRIRSPIGPTVMVAFVLSLVPLLFYRNAFPYFYVFIISPAVVCCGLVFDKLLEDLEQTRKRRFAALIYVLVAAVAVNGGIHYRRNFSDQKEAQREVVRLVHELFPDPVHYVDCCSMVPGFPKVGFFMSTWGIARYRSVGRPLLRNLLREGQPVFLLANRALIDPSGSIDLSSGPYALLPEDFATLRQNFVPHWGILHLAGKQLDLDEPSYSQEFEILTGGLYTVEADRAVTIDGRPFAPGDVTVLGPGRHTIASDAVPARITLRWGDHLGRPSGTPSKQPIFTGF